MQNKNFFLYGYRLTVALEEHIDLRLKVNQILSVYERYADGRFAVFVFNTDSTAKGTNAVYVYRCKLLAGQAKGFSVIINASQEEILLRPVWTMVTVQKYNIR